MSLCAELCCESRSTLLQSSVLSPIKAQPLPLSPLPGQRSLQGRGKRFQRFAVIRGSTARPWPRHRAGFLRGLSCCNSLCAYTNAGKGGRLLCAGTEMCVLSRAGLGVKLCEYWDGTAPVLKVIMDSVFLGKWELQMCADSWDCCSAGVVQLFGEFSLLHSWGLFL